MEVKDKKKKENDDELNLDMGELMKNMVARRLTKEKGIDPLIAEVMAESMIESSLKTKKGKEDIGDLQKTWDKMVEDSKKKNNIAKPLNQLCNFLFYRWQSLDNRFY